MMLDIAIIALGILLVAAGALTFILHLAVFWTGAIIVGVYLIVSRLVKWQNQRSRAEKFRIAESSIPRIYASIIDGSTPIEVSKKIFDDPKEPMIAQLAVGNCLSGGAFIADNFVERLDRGLAAARNSPPALSPVDLLRDLSLRRTAYMVEQAILLGGGGPDKATSSRVFILSTDYIIFVEPEPEDWKKSFTEETATINAAEWAKDAKDGIEAMALFADLFDQRTDHKTSERLVEAFEKKKAIIVPLRAVTDIRIRPYMGPSSTFYHLLQIDYLDDSNCDPNRAIVLISPPNEKGSGWAIARLCVVCFACCVVGNVFSHIKLLSTSLKGFDAYLKDDGSDS
jgi:hypothetical protein